MSSILQNFYLRPFFFAVGLLFCQQAMAYKILDIDQKNVGDFLRSDHTIVIGFDGNTQNQLKALIKQAVRELAGEVDQASHDAGFVPLKGFHILFVFDSRASIRKSFEGKTSKFDGKGFFKKVARGAVMRRAPEEVSSGTATIDATLRETIMQEINGLIDPNDVRIVSLFDDEWSVSRSEGGRQWTGRRVIKRTLRRSGSTSIQFDNQGPSAQFLSYLYGPSESALNIAIVNPQGQPVKRWAGMVAPMEVIESYVELKGVNEPKLNNDPSVIAKDEDAIDPFEGLIDLSVEFTYPDLGESVTHMKNYLGKIDKKCVPNPNFASSKHLRDYFYKAFVKIYHDVNQLNLAMADSDYIYLMNNRKPLLDFVDTATVFLRRYYAVQSEKFLGGLEGLSPADKELVATLRNVYVQVADMLKMTPKELLPPEKEWQESNLSKFESDPYLGLITKAIRMVDQDSAYCGAIL